MNRRDFALKFLGLAGAGEILESLGASSLGSGREARAIATPVLSEKFPKAQPLATRSSDPRLKGSYRFSRARWIYVRLQGTPSEIGFQHGYWLAEEIANGFKVVALSNVHKTKKDEAFFRRAARENLWPKVYPEYQEEIEGIQQGLKSRGVRLSLDDLIWLNAMNELADYYVPWYDKQHKKAEVQPITPSLHCSAFVATGHATRNHQIVMAHSDWASYLEGERWRIIFDIVPRHGHRILMDGYPGVIVSGDDFGINSAGLMITETTISKFHGWNPNGRPEFARARRAMQYAASIDEYVSCMLDENNGGYANDWLIGDRKTGEIGLFELGLKAHHLWRTRDGFFVSSNDPRDPKVIAEETSFNRNDLSDSPNARRVRWHQLMRQYHGQIDVEHAQRFLADHYDTYEKKEQPDCRTLCGHCDLGSNPKHEIPLGSVTGKVTDSRMTAAMSFLARRGHPCGLDFMAHRFLKAHPKYTWQAPLLRDMIAGQWTTFRANSMKPEEPSGLLQSTAVPF